MPVIVLMVLCLFAEPALAYVGPGLGAGTVGVVLGILGAILLGLFAVLYYPIKRVLKRKK